MHRGEATLDVLDGALVQSLNNLSIGSLAEGMGTLEHAECFTGFTQ